MLTSCGAQGKTTVFLITDTQIKEESFLEDIDNLLNTGEVPNLFAADEKAEIMEVGILLLVIARGGQKRVETFMCICYYMKRCSLSNRSSITGTFVKARIML